MPAQHGAWGFLLLPVALGVVAGGWAWTGLPVVATWVVLYPLSWAVTNRAFARRGERFDHAVRVWLLLTVPLVTASVVIYPWLAEVGIVYLVPFAINLGFARARRERDLVNDLVLVAECAAAVPVVAALPAPRNGWLPPWDVMTSADVALLTLVCALVLVGSTLHVKSLIRERTRPRFAVLSQWFALGSVPVVAIVGRVAGATWWLVVPFGLLAARAVLLRDRHWRPARLGVVELAGLVLVVVCAVPALR